MEHTIKYRGGKITSWFTMSAEDNPLSQTTQEVLGLADRLSEDWQSVVHTLENLDLREYRQSPDARGCLKEAFEQLTNSVRDINDLLEQEQDGENICGQTDGDAETQTEDTAFSVESHADDSKGLSLRWATQVDKGVSRAFQDLHTYLSKIPVALAKGDYKSAISAAQWAEHTLPLVGVACTMLALKPDGNTSTQLRRHVFHCPRYVQAAADRTTFSTPQPTAPLSNLGSDVDEHPTGTPIFDPWA